MHEVGERTKGLVYVGPVVVTELVESISPVRSRRGEFGIVSAATTARNRLPAAHSRHKRLESDSRSQAKTGSTAPLETARLQRLRSHRRASDGRCLPAEPASTMFGLSNDPSRLTR